MGPQSFDRGDVPLVQVTHACLARAHRLAVDMNRAGTALRNATAILRPRNSKLVSQYPQERHVRSDIDLPLFTIYCYLEHGAVSASTGRVTGYQRSQARPRLRRISRRCGAASCAE